MIDDNVIADTSASDQVATAASDTEVTQPEGQTPDASRTFTQEDLDAAISKRLAREQRKWEREQAQRVTAQPVSSAPLSADQFNSVDDYAEALAASKAERLLEQREMQRQQSELIEAYHDREEDARTRYDDFEQVAYNPNLKITTVMAQAIQTSDNGPDVAYYLGSNPKEAARISQLAAFMQAKEIGKIEARLTADPPVKRSSSAPPPINPVTPKGGRANTYDTTDPRSVDAMSTEDWIAAERLRQIKKMEAARNR